MKKSDFINSVDAEYFYDSAIDELELNSTDDSALYFDEWLDDNGHREVNVEIISRRTFASTGTAQETIISVFMWKTICLLAYSKIG